MPTIYRIGRFSVKIYPRDHRPPHVHIVGPDGQAKISLDKFQCISCWGFSEKDIKRIILFLKLHEAEIWEAWYEYQK